MLSIRLDSDIEKSISAIASAMNETKSSVIRAALIQYIEDKTDYISAVNALNKTKKRFSLDEVLKEFENEL